MSTHRPRALIWHVLGLWLLATWLGLATAGAAVPADGAHHHHPDAAVAVAHADCGVSGCGVGCATLPATAVALTPARPRSPWGASPAPLPAGREPAPELRPPIA